MFFIWSQFSIYYTRCSWHGHLECSSINATNQTTFHSIIVTRLKVCGASQSKANPDRPYFRCDDNEEDKCDILRAWSDVQKTKLFAFTKGKRILGTLARVLRPHAKNPFPESCSLLHGDTSQRKSGTPANYYAEWERHNTLVAWIHAVARKEKRNPALLRNYSISIFYPYRGRDTKNECTWEGMHIQANLTFDAATAKKINVTFLRHSGCQLRTIWISSGRHPNT